MALRGDDESLSGSNKGNFLELVELVGQYDSVLKLHLDKIKEKQASHQKPQVSLLTCLPAIVQFLEDLSEPPDPAGGEANMLLHSINFEFILCLEITPIFLETAVASNALQWQDLDLAAAYTVVNGVINRMNTMRTEEQFKEIYHNATIQVETRGINVPEDIPGQYCSTSATEDHQPQTLEEYYRGRMYFTFLDSLIQELHRRFKGKGNTDKIVMSLHCLIEPSKWKDTANAEALNAAHTFCEFYGFQEEEEQLLTELRVFHSSYTCSQISSHAILETFKDFEAHIVFPTFFKLLKIFATLPVSTASTERSFSKLKLLKTKLRNACGQEKKKKKTYKTFICKYVNSLLSSWLDPERLSMVQTKMTHKHTDIK
uniref:HAT C-terminal dimerisation domain-containing protein n=1 Tax=Cyprinus carpio TaxID=7962 RepID=A0A8C1LI83_CYPCA